MAPSNYLDAIKKEEQNKFNEPEKYFSFEHMQMLTSVDVQKYGEVAEVFRTIFFKNVLTKIKHEHKDISPHEAALTAGEVCNYLATEYCRKELGQ
tara:strand:+ start:240 stop:524 length:285 start_codon:yes stop_codon:yes gene_type:complete